MGVYLTQIITLCLDTSVMGCQHSMKKTSISIDMEAEKLRALRFYTEKKETILETELEDFLAKLYEKYVPSQTREYIESMEEPAEPPRPRTKRQPRTPVDTPTTVSEEVV